ncbi:MAG: archease [Candidatus Margulisiibacteriota bacterium]
MAALRFKRVENPLGIVTYGKQRKELFENAAYGLFSLMADLESVSPKQLISLKVKGDDFGSLLANWLNELIALKDSRKMLFRKFQVKALSDTGLEAEVSGEKIDPARHQITLAIKAAAYNQLQVGPGEAKIIFET